MQKKIIFIVFLIVFILSLIFIKSTSGFTRTEFSLKDEDIQKTYTFKFNQKSYSAKKLTWWVDPVSGERDLKKQGKWIFFDQDQQPVKDRIILNHLAVIAQANDYILLMDKKFFTDSLQAKKNFLQEMVNLAKMKHELELAGQCETIIGATLLGLPADLPSTEEIVSEAGILVLFDINKTKDTSVAMSLEVGMSMSAKELLNNNPEIIAEVFKKPKDIGRLICYGLINQAIKLDKDIQDLVNTGIEDENKAQILFRKTRQSLAISVPTVRRLAELEDTKEPNWKNIATPFMEGFVKPIPLVNKIVNIINIGKDYYKNYPKFKIMLHEILSGVLKKDPAKPQAGLVDYAAALAEELGSSASATPQSPLPDKPSPTLVLNQSSPTPVVNQSPSNVSLNKAKMIVTNGERNYVIKANGTVWAWGKGPLGDGTMNDSLHPVQVKNLQDISALSVGDNFGTALKKDGTVWFWGRDTLEPEAIDGITDVIDIAAMSDQFTWLKSDGTVWILRQNAPPFKIRELNEIHQITGGGDHLLALRRDGIVWAWGDNSNGQLGVGDQKIYDYAVKVPELTGVSFVTCAGDHSLALRNDGSLWFWGKKPTSMLDTSWLTGEDRSLTPFRVQNINALKITAGSNYDIAVTNNGSVWVWGYLEPIYLDDSGGWKSVEIKQFKGVILAAAGGMNHILLVKKDGTIWTWGNNEYGKLGAETYHDYSSIPLQVEGFSIFN